MSRRLPMLLRIAFLVVGIFIYCLAMPEAVRAQQFTPLQYAGRPPYSKSVAERLNATPGGPTLPVHLQQQTQRSVLQRLTYLERVLEQQGQAEAKTAAAEAAKAAATPITDMRGTVDQRKHLIGVLTKRTLRIAIQRAQES